MLILLLLQDSMVSVTNQPFWICFDDMTSSARFSEESVGTFSMRMAVKQVSLIGKQHQ